MTRTRIGLALATAVAGMAGLAGCVLATPGTDAPAADAPAADTTTLWAEERALSAIGYNPADLRGAPAQEPAPGASSASAAGPDGGKGTNRGKGAAHDLKHAQHRRLLGRDTLHGELAMRTKDGVKIVDVQRGTVTAIDDKTMTVKSADGFMLTWTFGNPLQVVEHRTTVQPSTVKVGTEIGVAGVKDGSATTARLIVIPASNKNHGRPRSTPNRTN
jgi:hypothetical protein